MQLVVLHIAQKGIMAAVRDAFKRKHWRKKRYGNYSRKQINNETTVQNDK